MKKLAVLVLCCLLLVGCSSGPAISDFDGTWVQVDADEQNTYQEAVITGDTMIIYYVNSKEDRLLYWYGTFKEPSEAVSKWEWISLQDKDKGEDDVFGLLRAQDDTKEFEYKNGCIVYERSALGLTGTVKLKKVD